MRKTKYLTIRLSEDLKKQVKAQAEKNRRTMASEIEVLLESGLQASAAK